MKIGFIGLGNVGGKLASSLLRNKFDLTVRDLEKNLTNDFKNRFVQRFNDGLNTNNLKLQIGEIYKGSVDGSGHLTLNSAHENDVLSFTKWLTTINSPSKIAVENWLQNYKFNTKLHERFKHYFTMLDSIRGTNFVKTFNPSWT